MSGVLLLLSFFLFMGAMGLLGVAMVAAAVFGPALVIVGVALAAASAFAYSRLMAWDAFQRLLASEGWPHVLALVLRASLVVFLLASAACALLGAWSVLGVLGQRLA